jgi:hypothetical protein
MGILSTGRLLYALTKKEDKMNVGEFYKDVIPVLAATGGASAVDITTDTTTVFAEVDLTGYAGALVIMSIGTMTDGDYEFQLFHADATGMSGEAEVASTDIIGSLPDWEDHATESNSVASVAYICQKGFIRVKVVSTNTSSGATNVGCIICRIKPSHMPAQS